MKDFRHTGKMPPATQAFIDFEIHYYQDRQQTFVARCIELPRGYSAIFYKDGDGFTVKTRNSKAGAGSIRYDRAKTEDEAMAICRKWVVRKIREARRS